MVDISISKRPHFFLLLVLVAFPVSPEELHDRLGCLDLFESGIGVVDLSKIENLFLARHLKISNIFEDRGRSNLPSTLVGVGSSSSVHIQCGRIGFPSCHNIDGILPRNFHRRFCGRRANRRNWIPCGGWERSSQAHSPRQGLQLRKDIAMLCEKTWLNDCFDACSQWMRFEFMIGCCDVGLGQPDVCLVV